MPAKNHDLHGSVPDTSEVVLLIIDVINDLEFNSGGELLEHARPMAKAVADLKRRAKEARVPVVYVNDNFGRWQSDLSRLIDHCLEDDVRGREIVQMLVPDEDDYFVLKPKHSGFFSTTLDTLLDYLKATTLVLTGMAGNICILFTANDAYMRDFNLVVPRDCIASNKVKDNEYALEQMETVLKADIRPSTELDFEVLKRRAQAPAQELKPKPQAAEFADAH